MDPLWGRAMSRELFRGGALRPMRPGEVMRLVEQGPLCLEHFSQITLPFDGAPALIFGWVGANSLAKTWTRLKLIGPKCWALILSTLLSAPALAVNTVQPLNGCTFYKSRLLPKFPGCAEFSAVLGRNGCRKVKGICPACITYPGDDLQMWLPDYFIEITKHAGGSIFTESADSAALRTHLAIGQKWWEASTKVPLVPSASRGSQSSSSADSFWHARILTVPYGAEANTYLPLSPSKGTGLPTCFSALSEFLPAQWNFNLADGPFAVAWAPVGAPMCLSIVGGAAAASADEAKRQVGMVAGGIGTMRNLPADTSCANPVGVQEALAKDAQPSADTLSPLSGDLSKLCMGTWGNLIPRTGWILSDDPYMSALAAAYKFQSLAGDMHLNPALKLQSDDKWQIVYPPRFASGCFHPGSPLASLPGSDGDDVVTRTKDEVELGGVRKAHTYVIAVWRRRHSCEEPGAGAWDAAYKVNVAKNKALCQTVGSF